MKKGETGRYKKKKLVLIKRRMCQKVIDDGLHSGEERRCGRPVEHPNHYLCRKCIKEAESEGQAMGVEE